MPDERSDGFIAENFEAKNTSIVKQALQPVVHVPQVHEDRQRLSNILKRHSVTAHTRRQSKKIDRLVFRRNTMNVNMKSVIEDKIPV